MAFLDNSGDIILDAVLTDTGRLRLAQGDGSFKISKFALGDDEINYALYNKNHASGSAYYDLEILQTPILEAFTNNSAAVKSRLMTMGRTNVLYMPVLKLNDANNGYDGIVPDAQAGSSGLFRRTPPGLALSGDANVYYNGFVVAVDNDTFVRIFQYRTEASTSDLNKSIDLGSHIRGCIQGYTPGESDHAPAYHMIRVDQGLDTNQIAPSIGMDTDLMETAYIIEMDYRLGRIKQSNSENIAPVNFIDDDNIATYYLTSDSYVNPANLVPANETRTTAAALAGNNPQVFDGPRGSTLHFRIEASQELKNSTYLFEQLGDSEDANASGNLLGFGTDDGLVSSAGMKIYKIDTTVRVIGANTGYRLDIPVRYIKIQ
tara:strand:- start:13413 stop:14537 length:1125 start_codon:yes stop_codon:yes gene_type:complete